MKKRLILGLMFLGIFISAINFTGCNTSEGAKFGTLQKISHKTFPCEYYVAEFSFEGGVAVQNSDGKGSTYSNTQSVEITAGAVDSLQHYLGDKVIFDYKDRGAVLCGETKLLTMIKRK